MSINNYKDLAINGGEPVRSLPMPERKAFGDGERAAVQRVFDYYDERSIDPGYQGFFEEKFCSEFAEYMGGGYADAVASGTASIYTALAALDLPKGSEVLISPVTDSGPLNCIILLGLTPVLIDSAVGSYNTDLEQVKSRITDKTSCLLLVHTGGEPVAETKEIAEYLKVSGIKLLEDCSQATGAEVSGAKVGSFGDIAAYSTMYRKNLIAGASGGLVYTKDLELYRNAISHADRGKQPWRTDINQNDPGFAKFPALNLNTDEISCAMGSQSLKRLDKTIKNRSDFAKSFISELKDKSSLCRPAEFHKGFSPFFLPVFVDETKIDCSKTEFAKALAAEGIPNNVHYGCVISSWGWAAEFMKDDFKAENAENMRDTSFNLFLNENYGEKESKDCINAILKLEKTLKL